MNQLIAENEAGMSISALIAIATPVLGSLAGAIVFLFRMLHSHATATKTELKECQDKHDVEMQERIKIVERIGTLEGKIEGYDFGKIDGRREELEKQELRIAELTDNVLKLIHQDDSEGR